MSSILVAYASKHGATQGIAECISKTLEQAENNVVVQPVGAVGDLDGYDAFVIGSAAYMGRWLKYATEFVRQNQVVLATRPVWLFSSGPVGTATVDGKGRDVLTACEPKEFAEFKEAINPRGLQVFFGALDPSKLTVLERLPRLLPAGRNLMPEGDFRDWKAIEAWAEGIARELPPATIAEPLRVPAQAG
jgi:menaquinone-dependent protoporphyrinogen oxidase